MSTAHSNRYRALIECFVTTSVTVLGDVMLDTYLQCDALGVANEAPVPLLEISRQVQTAGGAANVAYNLARLGVRTRLIGMVGKDHEAQILIDLLGGSGVIVCPLVTSRPTTQKIRVLSDTHYYLRVDEEEVSPLTDGELTLFCEVVKASLESTRFLVLSDYDKGMLTAATAAIVRMWTKDSGIKILADLKPSNITHWGQLDLITPNLAEARTIYSMFNPGSLDALDELELAHHLRTVLGCDVVLKLAREGMLVASRSGEITKFEALCKTPCNVTGAGDTVLSTLAACLASGATLEESAYLANIAASIAVSHAGTYAVSADELIQRLAIVAT